MKRRYFTMRVNRHLFKMLAVSVAAQIVLGFVLGFVFALLVVAAAFLGYQVGVGRGFVFGMDQSFANVLRANLAQLHEVEEAMSGELAPDDPARIEVARLRGELLEELRRVA